MKYFNDGIKVNFVDENNVFIGYELSSQCCESAFFTFNFDENSLEDDVNIQNRIIHYTFDTTYFKDGLEGDYNETNFVKFKLIQSNNSKGIPIYLNLVNIHNGYYAHGFEVTIKGEEFKAGCIEF